MIEQRGPTRGRLIFLLIVAIVVLIVEGFVVSAYALRGQLFAGLHWLLPLVLIVYALYTLWSSSTKLRAAGK